MTDVDNSETHRWQSLSDDDLLTLAEVAVIVKVPVNTLRWWRQRGDGPVFFKLGRHLVTTRGDLQRWIEEQRKLATSPRIAATRSH